MRIALTGANGRLGRAFMREFPDTIPLTRKSLDLGCPESIRSVVSGLKVDVIVNCAAMTDMDACEAAPTRAYLINSESPTVIAQHCKKNKIQMVHISTDAVFDGRKGLYKETDEPAPLNVYGDSKLKGEQGVLGEMPEALVIRTAWLYGTHDSFPVSPNGVFGRLGSPAFAPDLVRAAALLLTQRAAGLVHFSNSGVAWRPAWPKRPPNATIATTRYTDLTGMTPRSWRETHHEWEAACHH